MSVFNHNEFQKTEEENFYIYSSGGIGRPLLGKYWWHFIKAKVRIVWKVLCCYHGDNEGLSVINHSSYERSQSMKMTINRKLHENDCDFYFSRQTIRLFLYK